ncbi:Pr6Pr family membrane protein [Microbacterium natoriense]|uniref:Pr6Pr family membrane protein n=1 Tax=Microbacterium natoriense TaxID=284570 RepID=UPI0027D774D7|nr:Pr6Pr family membrane protein [Microbacterium natoriense]
MTRAEQTTSWWPYLRLAIATLGFVAIGNQLLVNIDLAKEATTPWGSHIPTIVTNYFSFFTVQSNFWTAMTFAAAGIWALTKGRGAAREPRWLAVSLLCVSTYMILTGIIYNLLLRSNPLTEAAAVPWSNEVMHIVIPLLVLIDVILAPKRRSLSLREAWAVVVFPIVFAVFSMLRANTVVSPVTGDPYWYPLPFLNPHTTPGGYFGVAGYLVGIAALLLIVSMGMVWAWRRRS